MVFREVKYISQTTLVMFQVLESKNYATKAFDRCLN